MPRPRSDIKARVVRAARKRFLAEGVDGASLRRIAADARTSIGMVYYYFPTKDALFLAVLEEAYAKVLSDLTAALDDALPVEERIRRLYARIGALSDEEVVVVRLVLREALISSRRLDQVIERFQRGHLPAMLKLIADGIAGGTFDPGIHPAILIASMMGLGGPAQLMRRVIEPRSPFPLSLPTRAEQSDQMVSILLHGVGKKPA
jgi:AcrR family transcriptional regulator